MWHEPQSHQKLIISLIHICMFANHDIHSTVTGTDKWNKVQYIRYTQFALMLQHQATTIHYVKYVFILLFLSLVNIEKWNYI